MVRTRDKQQKQMHEEEMDNGNNDATVAQTNNNQLQCSFLGVSYLKLSVQVKKATNATATMKTRLQEVFRCI